MALRLSPWWLLAAAVAALVLLLPPWESGSRAERTLPEELAGEPDIYLRDATITQFHSSGGKEYELNADEIRHFSSTGLTRLTRPDLLLHSDDTEPWRTRANSGYVRERPATDLPSESEEEVYLSDDVELSQRNPDGEFTELHTRSLYLYPQRQYATTTENVMIDTHVGRTKAVGLQGDLRDGQLTLSSDAAQRVHTIVLVDQFK